MWLIKLISKNPLIPCILPSNPKEVMLQVLKKFGFHPVFIGRIHNILKSAMLFIKINGRMVDFFPFSRGVR